jgi:hypothetical protein
MVQKQSFPENLEIELLNRQNRSIGRTVHSSTCAFELLQTAGSTNSVNPPNGSVRISDFPAHRIIVTIACGYRSDLEATPRVSLTSAIDPTSPVLEILEGMRVSRARSPCS